MALLRWLNFLLGSLTLTLKVLFFGFISLGATICYFFLWKILIMFFYRFQWLSFKLKGGCPYSLHSLWLFLCCLGRSLWSWDALWEDIFKLGASASTTKFCEWIQLEIDVYISHNKYQLKPHSSPWFSAAFTAAITHRNHFFLNTNRINLLNLE